MARGRVQIQGMRRFFADRLPESGEVTITGAEAQHMARVLRMQVGDQVILCDGGGYDVTAVLTGVQPGTVSARIAGRERSKSEPAVRVRVYQAVIKNDHFDYVIQKCTELGADDFVPFLSERCVKRPKSDGHFLERAKRIAAEAAKQCGRSRIPEVRPLETLEALPESFGGRTVLFAYENERTQTLKQALRTCEKEEGLALIVGPEGGFTEEEARRLVAAGARSVSLGRLILRAETAGAAALAMIGYEYGQ